MRRSTKEDLRLLAGFGIVGLVILGINVALFVGACLIVKAIFF